MKKFTLLLVFALIANVFLTSDLFGQINVVGVSSPAATATGGATTLTINKPAGLAVGHVMIANIQQVGNDNNSLSDATRNGWTVIAGNSNNSGNDRFRGTLLYRVADAADVAAANFAFTIDSDQDDAQGYIVAFSGVDVTGGVDQNGAAGGPFDVDPGSWSEAASNSLSATALTTVTANAAVIMFAGLADNSNISTWATTSPGALSELYDNPLDGPGGAVDLGIGAAWATKAAVGSTGNGTAITTGNPRHHSILIALRAVQPPSVVINPPALSTTTILVGGTVNLTATRSANGTWPGGSGTFDYTWSATGPAGLSFTGNPSSGTGTTDATTASGFSVAGDYFITCTVTEQGGGQTVIAANKKVTVLAAAPTVPSLWATSSDGTQVSSFVVANGTYFSGPSNIFAPTFTGTGGGSSTAALGLSDKYGPLTNNTYYYLPNNSGNNGVVTVYGRSSAGTIAQVATLDVNGAGSNTSLGYVRLGMHPDGSGWIIAASTTTVYLVKFVPSGVDGLGAATITVEDNTVTLVGGAASTFQNGDLCISGAGNIYALANDGAGVTQIFRGTPNGSSTTLTKVFDLVDNTGAPFTGRVNGVAFDAAGSIYISTDNGLFYVDAATVNGPAGTVGCFLVYSVSGLQDLASNIFPTQSTLPVTLGTFSVTKQGDFAMLNWKTTTEINTDHFEIERSYDGINFTSVAMKAAAGNSSADVNYQHTDPINYNYPIVYYRLKTVDIDAKSSYSKIVALRLSNGPIKDLTVFPNPFTSDLKLQINSLTETTGTVRISNAVGQVVYNRNITLQKGDNIVVLTSGLETLKPGMHLMEVITTDGKVTQKIIKR